MMNLSSFPKFHYTYTFKYLKVLLMHPCICVLYAGDAINVTYLEREILKLVLKCICILDRI